MPTGAQKTVRDNTICALITTLDEEREIAECIESLLWCDEILVVDSFSTDQTPQIVASFPGVRFEQRTYYGSAAQKNWAMDQCHTDWILIFDADERCSPELCEEIQALLAASPGADCYRIRRRLFFLDHHIRFCGWHNDLVVRLTKKGRARYPNRRVHADMVTEGPAPALKSCLDHHMVRDLGEYARRICKYGVWGAAQLWKENRKSGVKEVVFRPAWRFVRAYFVQGGILDGLHGFIFCGYQALGTFVKWGVLWGWGLTGNPRLPEFDESDDTWKAMEESASSADDVPVSS